MDLYIESELFGVRVEAETLVSIEIQAKDDAGMEENVLLPVVRNMQHLARCGLSKSCSRKWVDNPLEKCSGVLREGKLSGDSPPKEVSRNLKTISLQVETRI